MSRAIHPNRQQMFLLPPSLDDWVPAGHPVRFVRDLIDSIDLASLGIHEKPGDEGRPHYAPQMLLGVWVYGYMERIRSSRQLERACVRDIAFRWLTGNHQPDHNTLWRFFKAHKLAIRELFKRVVRVASDAGLVGFVLHAVDGTKIAAASSMDTAHHRKALEGALRKLDTVIATHLSETEAEERRGEGTYDLPAELQDPEKRKAAIREALARLDEAKTNHLHPAEPEARVMKGRGGKVLGYNAQAVADRDSDLIVATDVVNAASDNAQLVPMLDETQKTTGRVAETTVADAGYDSGKQFEEAERRKLPVVVATATAERGTDEFHKSKFQYDAERDVYICPRGEVLPFQRIDKASENDKKYDRRVYRCHNRECPVRSQCTSDKKGRAIKQSPYDEAYARQLERNAKPQSRMLLSKRKAIIEHHFAIAKSIDGFRRFTMRGLEAAKAQWALVCAAINLRKLHARWLDGSLTLRARPA